MDTFNKNFTQQPPAGSVVAQLQPYIDRVIAQMKSNQQNTTQVPLSNAVANNIDNKDAKKPSFLASLGTGALNLAKDLLPTALSFIPGVGGIASSIAKTVLSSNNDDEWFGEYTSAGATFNELLLTQEFNGTEEQGKCITLVPNMAVLSTDINFNESVKDVVFPSMLNHIRIKTNNVLIDDVDLYWQSIKTSMQMYAIYYTAQKYLKLADSIPLNSPQMPDQIAAISPKTISQFRGIVENLREYLKTTVSLPYALVAYIRWRYGTAFLSDSSDRTGLIMYDFPFKESSKERVSPWAYNTDFINSLETALKQLRATIVTTGRATADIKMAYAAHMHSYDVDERHYDSKEFNLRCNITKPSQKIMEDNVRLILDSKLKMSPAIQAVTLSTYKPNLAVQDLYGYGPHFNNAEAKCLFPVTNVSILISIPSVSSFRSVIELSDYAIYAGVGNWYYLDGGYLGAYSDTWAHQSLYNIDADETADVRERTITNYREYLVDIVYRYAAIALQMHYNGVSEDYRFANVTEGREFITSFYTSPLSYDMAFVTSSQLDAIHRTALRNLVRGDYTRKEPIAPTVKESVSEFVNAATDGATIKVVEKK